MSKTKTRRPLGPSLDYLDWRHLARAVLRVVEDNRNVERFSWCFEADNEGWFLDTEMRRDLLGRVRTYWCQFAKRDGTYFPYSEDCIARLYWRLSGLGEKTRKRYLQEVSSEEG
jgi:hypothetical protein